MSSKIYVKKVRWGKNQISRTVYIICYYLGKKCVHSLVLSINISERTLKKLMPLVAFERKVTWWVGNRE